MIFRTFISVVFIFLSSCVTNHVTKSESDKIAIDMSSFNTRLSGYLYRKEMKGDMSSLSAEKYLELVKTQANPSEQQYVDFILIQKPEVKIVGTKDDFTICTRLVLKKFGICDKTTTNFVDRYLEGSDLVSDLQTITLNLSQNTKTK